MDVSHSLRSIIPTLDGLVFKLLAGTNRRLSGREVHRLAGAGSVHSVQLVLRRLVTKWREPLQVSSRHRVADPELYLR